MKRNFRVIHQKLTLWLIMSSTNINDMTDEDIKIFNFLENDSDIFQYLKDCEKEEKYVDTKKWSKVRAEKNGFNVDCEKS